MRLHVAIVLLCGACLCCSTKSATRRRPSSLLPAAGVAAVVNQTTGEFEVLVDGLPWLQSAGFTLGDTQLQLQEITRTRGSDVLGSYVASNVSWKPAFGVSGVSTEVRVYDDESTLVFAQHFARGVKNTTALFRPRPPPPPKGHCGVVMHTTDQAGGHPVVALHNASQESCCAACISNRSCSAWVLSDPLRELGRTCWLCSGSTGSKPGANRTTGFVRASSNPKPLSDQDRVLSAFPSFTPHNRATSTINFITWAGCQISSSYWGQWSSTAGGAQQPKLRQLSANARAGAPVLLYDQDLRSVVISPLRNFWVGIHSTARAENAMAPASSFDAGIKATVESIPAGFLHETIVHVGRGIDRSLLGWGDRLLLRGEKKRIDPYSDFVLSHLGFWTDHGAYYYHNHDNFSNAEVALQDVVRLAKAQDIPLRYMQFDDWWFQQDGGDSGGLVSWQPPAKVFPGGLTDWLGIPLSLYAAMYSPNNSWAERRDYGWVVDDTAHALPLGRQFYDDLFANGTQAAMVMFEQDFLCSHNTNTHLTNRDVDTGRLWLKAMDEAALSANISVQFCMMDPVNALSTTTLRSVTNGRATGDNTRVEAANGRGLGLTSMLHHALGFWPSRDNVWTNSSVLAVTTDHENPRQGLANDRAGHRKMNEPMVQTQTLLALMSGGPYGVADKAGSINASLAMRSCRSDGLLLRADKPATVLDSAWSRTFSDHDHTNLNTADRRSIGNLSASTPPCCALQCACTGTCPAGCPNCCSPRALENAWGSYSQIGALRWSYFIGVDLQAPYPLTAKDYDPLVYRYDRSGDSSVAVTEWVGFEYWHGLDRKDLTLLTRNSTYYLPRCRSDKDARMLGSSFVVVAPVEPTSGWTYLGEPGKIVTASSRRVFRITTGQSNDGDLGSTADGVSTMSIELLAAPDELLRLMFLPPAALQHLRSDGADGRSAQMFELSCRARSGHDTGDEVTVVVRCGSVSCRCTGAW